MSKCKNQYERWLCADFIDEETKAELLGLSSDEIEYRFSEYMTFGTAGLRAKMGAGCNLMNTCTVAHATEAIARLILSLGDNSQKRGVVVAYDSRINSKSFAKRTAEVLSASGIAVYLFGGLRPTPVLSFAIRRLGCIAGINITASHNSSEYNGYKVYWKDGAQLPPDHAGTVSAIMNEIDIFDDVPSSGEPSLITEIGSEIDDAYIECVLAERVDENAVLAVSELLRVVYTPLHGAGCELVPRVLKASGVKKLYTVDEQMLPDGSFPTVRFPNPEFPEAFDLGITKALSVGSDLIIATDPDCDRVGVMAKDKSGNFLCISGNQMGALLLDYIITAYETTGRMPKEPYAVKSIVTSELAAKICASHGVKMYNVLTGFKYIGEVIKNHEKSGSGSFIFGFEESYGYLKGTYARDKDAVVASMLICEMAAYYRKRRMTLCDALDGLFKRYGYFKESVFSIFMDSLDWQADMANIMESLRREVPAEIAGRKITETRDYESGIVTQSISGAKSPTGLPESDVLYYKTINGDSVIIRPSGTEPKIKVYVLTNGKTAEAAETTANECAKAVRELLEELIRQ